MITGARKSGEKERIAANKETLRPAHPARYNQRPGASCGNQWSNPGSIQVKRTGLLGPALFARLYGPRAEDVLFTVYDAALAFKATLPSLVPAGDIGDTDVYGAQQHAPLLHIAIPL